MKKRFAIPTIASMAMVGLFGCSSESSSPMAGSLSENSSNVARISVSDAQAYLARYSRSVVESWDFSDSASDSSKTVSVDVESTLKNDNFALNADIQITDDSVYTIASAGLDGDGAAWMIQVEKGAIVYSWRDQGGSEWLSISTDKLIAKQVLANVRLERVGQMIVLSLDGNIITAFKDGSNGGIKVSGTLTIGFDKLVPGQCHCKNGQVEQIDVETVKEIKDTVKTVVDTSASCEASPKGCGGVTFEKGDSLKLDGKWIAEWDFNDSANVGLDVTGHGHDAVIGEGAVATVDGIAGFDGKSGFSVKLDKDININDFVVEARVKPTKFGTMQNIIVAEPPGRGVDGWQLRIDEGVLTVHLRDTDKDFDDWSIFPGERMALNEWSDIRLERSADSVKLFQNGELTVAAAYTGDLTQMAYDWSIGYDGMQQNFHDRYFVGEMDYVRFGSLDGFTEGSVTEKAVQPLVAWEFNEPSFVGLDRMANNSTHYEVGFPKIVDSTVVLDGQSGLQVDLSKVFLRNTFAVETRVKPSAFSDMQNIIVAEPPGRYGDGWIIRLDNGVLTVHFRDEDVDGTQWNILKGDKLALNEWTDIRVERTADSVKVFQNGNLMAKAASKGDVSQLRYNIGIGYDAMKQAKGNRYFNGEIDYIRYYGL